MHSLTSVLTLPHEWGATPIRRRINPFTGLIEGDDSGYRNILTLKKNPTPLVAPQVLCRPSYDGVTEYGKQDYSIRLDGGLKDGMLVVRETVARALEEADRVIGQVSEGMYQVCAVDGFRSQRRQAAGFTRMLTLHMQRLNATHEHVLDFIRAGNLADGTFSWVNVDSNSPQYSGLTSELYCDTNFMEQLRLFMNESGQTEDEAMKTYITISANSGLGLTKGWDIPLVSECNAHAGGGAVDILLVDRLGRPVNIVPFDYPGEEAGMDFMEKAGSFEDYIAHAMDGTETGELIRIHLDAIGFPSPSLFRKSDWERFHGANRMLYHMAKAMGWTYYSSEHGGENWHFEPGNIVYDAFTGEPLFAEALTAQEYPDSGNPGHTLQKCGRQVMAVWGGSSGHEQARQWGL